MQRAVGTAAPLVESEFEIQVPCQCKVCGFFPRDNGKPLKVLRKRGSVIIRPGFWTSKNFKYNN